MKEEIFEKFKNVCKGDLINADVIEGLKEILGDEYRGIIFSLTDEEESKVREFIGIDNYNTVDELRALRNYLVLTVSEEIKKDICKNDYLHTYVTVFTSMIDNKIFRLGGEV